MKKIEVVYNTTSSYKQQELASLLKQELPGRGGCIGDLFDVIFRSADIKEDLEVDLVRMVLAEAREAYARLRVPCIVEHAGLIFEEYESAGYPGGLTKPMWNTLGEHFVEETNSAGRRAIARAVVAYCDGSRLETFVGDTRGVLSDTPSGSRAFYWDTIFIPKEDPANMMTYAEMVDTHGLQAKSTISQSTKALMKFFEYRACHEPRLWPR